MLILTVSLTLFFTIFNFILLIWILLIVKKLYKKESFCGCYGMQYNGIAVQANNPSDPICSNEYQRGGGCYTNNHNEHDVPGI